MAVDWEIEQHHLCAVARFTDDPQFRDRVIRAADMARYVVQAHETTACHLNHVMDYRKAAAIALYLAEEQQP